MEPSLDLGLLSILSIRHGGARGGLTVTSPLAPFASIKSSIGPWEIGEEGLAPPTASLPIFNYRMPAFPLSLMPDLPRCLASGNEVLVFAKGHSSS